MTEPAGVYRRLIPEQVIPGRRLGRHVHHDPRSREFPAETAPVITDVLHASFGLPLDQGQLGSCTANALCGAANSQPNYTGPLAWPHVSSYMYPHIEDDAITLYERETGDEGQPYPPNDPGGSGLAVCKAARELGWLERYAHTFDLDTALRALVLRPVIAGINWYDSFDTPNSSGLVSISSNAQVRGGHEVVADQIVTNGKLVGFWNSWGTGYGLGGRFWMTWATLERLLAEEGDVTVPGAAVAR